MVNPFQLPAPKLTSLNRTTLKGRILTGAIASEGGVAKPTSGGTVTPGPRLPNPSMGFGRHASAEARNINFVLPLNLIGYLYSTA